MPINQLEFIQLQVIENFLMQDQGSAKVTGSSLETWLSPSHEPLGSSVPRRLL